MIERILNKISGLFLRGVVDKTYVEEDGTVTHDISGLEGEEIPTVELFQQYGFASVPKRDCEVVLLSPDSDRDNSVIVATEDSRFRIKEMEDGEVAIYTDEGDKIRLKRDRTIFVETQNLEASVTQEINVTCPDVQILGNVKITGNLTVTGTITGASVSDSAGSMADIRGSVADLGGSYDIHIHGGVTTGPGVTSGPQAP